MYCMIQMHVGKKKVMRKNQLEDNARYNACFLMEDLAPQDVHLQVAKERCC